MGHRERGDGLKVLDQESRLIHKFSGNWVVSFGHCKDLRRQMLTRRVAR